MAPKTRVLVIDDELSMREMLTIMLGKEGHEVVTAASRAEAARVLERGPVDLIVTDLRLPDGDGIEILRHVKAAAPETVVVVMTAYSTTETAVAALKLGAHDYLIKPFDVDELKIVVRNALEKRQLEDENRLLKAELRRKHGLDRLVGASPSMIAVFDMIRTVARTSSTVLITGESGTGKELAARAIHSLSPRQDAAFVSINCGALPETLLESELFGHVKGAFTDAHQAKRGLFEVAHRGTIFLDEIADTPPAMQVKLLRVLQEKQIRRVGGTSEIDVDARVIAASNQSLEELVRDKRFREDLFYRLNVIPLRIPPLRERREDIPLLANHFLSRLAVEMGKSVRGFSGDALAELEGYAWPGNVRELENVVERAVALESSEQVAAVSLPRGVRPVARAQPVLPELHEGFALDAYLAGLEARLVDAALERAGGDRAAASRLLGIAPRSLRYLISKHRPADKN
ncbi:MAG: sigma-54-dependent transcriptional regulator [Vicinamibacteria bacterium]